MRNLYLIAFWLVAITFSSRAFAEQGDLVFGATPSYAYLVTDDEAQPQGGGGSLWLRYQITDSWGIGATGLWTVHHLVATEKEEAATGQVLSAMLTANYTLDLLPRLSPIFEAGIGALFRRLRDFDAVDLGVKLGLAIDYWVLPWLSVGGAAYYYAFVTDLNTFPIYVEIGPRISVRFRSLFGGRSPGR